MEVHTLYSNPSRQEQEESFFKTFCSVHKELNIKNPEDCRRQPPNPDYIFPFSQKKIGIELTTLVLNKPGLVLDKSGKTTSLAAIRSAQNECLRRAAQIAKEDKLPHIAVDVQFCLVRKPIDIDEATKELVDFLKKKIPEIDDTESWHYPETGLKYCKWIKIQLGTLNGQKWLCNHRFTQIRVNWMTIDPIDEVQARIDEKQSKFLKY